MSMEVEHDIALEDWEDYQGHTEVGGTPYPTAECRDGGLLDLRPNDPAWPSP